MQPVIDHVSITVKDIRKAEEFYDKFLPIIGYDINLKAHALVAEHAYEAVEYYHSHLTFCLINPREEYLSDPISRRRPGALHHLAFRVENKEAVDEVFKKVQAISALIVHPPKFWPEYCDTYYAFFFKDSEGIELEVVHCVKEDVDTAFLSQDY